MRYGYARVSTIDQDTALQDSALGSARCKEIVREKRSGVKKRPELEALLKRLDSGDELVYNHESWNQEPPPSLNKALLGEFARPPLLPTWAVEIAKRVAP